LGRSANLIPQTASGHLSRLLLANVITVERHGRNRYYRLASPKIAKMIETLIEVATEQDRRLGVRDRYRVTARSAMNGAGAL